MDLNLIDICEGRHSRHHVKYCFSLFLHDAIFLATLEKESIASCKRSVAMVVAPSFTARVTWSIIFALVL